MTLDEKVRIIFGILYQISKQLILRVKEVRESLVDIAAVNDKDEKPPMN